MDHGFFDFKSLQCGVEIEDKIFKHCRETISFVQLVEDVTLVEPHPSKKNWCFEEYEHFAKGMLPVAAPADLGNRCFFTLAGGEKVSAPAGMGVPYQHWYNKMADTLHIVLDKCNTEPFDDLDSKVEEIAHQIVNVPKQLFEFMLATWP